MSSFLSAARGHQQRCEGGVRFKESLTFAGDDSPMNTLLLSMLGAVAEFERSLILERQREGIAIAKAAGKYKGRKASLSQTQASELSERLAKGESVTALATEYGVSRQTVYNYKTFVTPAVPRVPCSDPPFPPLDFVELGEAVRVECSS